MDKKKGLFIIGVAVIIVLGIIALVIGRNNANKPVEVDNLNDNVLKDTEIANIKIVNQSVVTRNGLSTYLANAKNDKSEKVHVDKVYITFVMPDGEELTTLVLDDITLDADYILPISIEFDKDISKATKIEYKTERAKEVAS